MNTNTLGSLSARAPYGASELRQLSHRYFGFALGISIALHLVVAVSCILATDAPGGPEIIVSITPIDPGLPPSIVERMRPPVTNAPRFPGIERDANPVPIPDQRVSPDQTIPTQKEYAERVAPHGQDVGQGGELPAGIVEPDDGQPPPEFLPVEKYPIPVRLVTPAYPEIPLKAGIEGKVWVKIWVDKQGKPRQALVLKSTNDLFNDAALEAARQYLFSPAYMNSGPVAVWVVVPFSFKLTKG